MKIKQNTNNIVVNIFIDFIKNHYYKNYLKNKL